MIRCTTINRYIHPINIIHFHIILLIIKEIHRNRQLNLSVSKETKTNLASFQSFDTVNLFVFVSTQSTLSHSVCTLPIPNPSTRYPVTTTSRVYTYSRSHSLAHPFYIYYWTPHLTSFNDIYMVNLNFVNSCSEIRSSLCKIYEPLSY